MDLDAVLMMLSLIRSRFFRSVISTSSAFSAVNEYESELRSRDEAVSTRLLAERAEQVQRPRAKCTQRTRPHRSRIVKLHLVLPVESPYPSEVNMASERVTLKIPRPLYEQLQEVIQGTGFRSANAFVVHVLRDLVAETRDPSTALSPREVDLIRERLRNLGYL